MARFRRIFSAKRKYLAVLVLSSIGPLVHWALAGLWQAALRGGLKERSLGAGCPGKRGLGLCSVREAGKGFSRPRASLCGPVLHTDLDGWRHTVFFLLPKGTPGGPGRVRAALLRGVAK